MRLLERIEHRLGSLIEGAFRRRIPRRIEPVEVGRALLAAVDKHKRVSMACVYAPNKFTVFLSEGDHADLSSLARTLEEELKGVLREKAEKDQLRFIGPVTLAFAPDPQLEKGGLSVQAEFCEGQCPKAGPPRVEEPRVDTQTYRKGQLTAGSYQLRGAYLVVESGRAAALTVELKDGLLIGRSAKCDLVLEELNVSRVHARVSWRDGGWYIEDNDSTNGLYVNGKRAASSLLRPGDRIQVGTAVLAYKEQL